MLTWLRGTTRVQRIVLALTAIAVVADVVSVAIAAPTFALAPLAILVCGIPFRKDLLWRVRNRLLVTYVLFGVVPLFLIALLLMLAGELLLGQFAAQLVRKDIDARVDAVRSAAQTLAVAAAHG